MNDPALAPTLPQDTQPEIEKPAQANLGFEIILPSNHIDPDQLPPAIMDRFDDLHFLGRGGMGTVYRGFDKQLAGEVAFNFVPGHDAALFLREARAQARITHDNVCKIYDVGFADGQPYITRQLVRGEPLSIACQNMTLEEKIKVIREAASALHEAHRLGLVHRDVKPGNILIERTDDGRWRPFVMDFGLARMVGEQGETVTGHVAGTPAYMAPEQARGEIRSLDRRTDVYSLGATFYSILADRPPFVEEQPWKILMRIETEDAPALRSVCPNVPHDLETIVMKCLERDPARRYDSARALGEDLQRYLDGEPVLARKASVMYRLAKRARKHKLLVGLVAAAFAAIITVIVVGVRAGRIAAEEARIAQELGEDVKEMELFLRNAYGLPNHDVEKERDVVRARLAGIAQMITTTGKLGEGPGHYAIGRGFLALGDPEKARDELERALAAGYAPPELEFALGQALGEIYRKALKATERIQNKEEKEAKIREIETNLRDPAMKHLQAARGAALDSPAYVEGLIAYYEGKHDEALVKAKEAFEKASWLYEAKKLEGDVLYAQGSKYRTDAQFDYDKMMTFFGPAAEAYRIAGDIARSDPEVHRATCELWTQTMYATVNNAMPPKNPFATADAACNRAVEASSKDGRARVQRAFLHVMLAYSVAQGEVSGEDPVRRIQDTIRLAEEVVVASPDDAMAHYVLGGAFLSDALYAERRSADGSASQTRAIAELEAALRIEPRFSWALKELAGTLTWKLASEGWRGQDIEATHTRALDVARQSIALDPTFPLAWNNLGLLHFSTSQAILERGQSPKEHVELALRAYAEDTRLAPLSQSPYTFGARTHVIMAKYEVLTGQNPDSSLQRALDGIEKAKQCGGSRSHIQTATGEAHLVRALQVLQQGGDPTRPIEEARSALRDVAKETPWNLDLALARTRTEIVALRWAMSQKKVTAAIFDEALAPLQAVLNDDIANPSVWVALAEVYALRAAWLAQSKKTPADDLQKGLAMADKALAINPRKSQALAAKGQLYLVKARSASDTSGKTEAANYAKDAFDEALRLNGLLARETEAARKEVDQLLDGKQ